VNSETEPFARRLDSAGWALFIIWVGIALLADVGWGWGLIGVAAIILGEGVVRWLKGLRIHGFSIAMGLMFLLAGLWELLSVTWPLIPILIIGFGLALLFNAFRGHRAR
jgi:hypothetical protein